MFLGVVIISSHYFSTREDKFRISRGNVISFMYFGFLARILKSRSHNVNYLIPKKIESTSKYEAFIITITVHTSIACFNTYCLRRTILHQSHVKNILHDAS